VLGAGFGVFSVFFTPPSQSLDEPSHWARAYTLSQGTVLAERRGHDTGAQMPSCAVEYVGRVQGTADDAGPIPRGRFWTSPGGCDTTVFVAYNNTAVYSPLPYAAPAAAIALTRAVGLPVPVQFYGGRLASLTVYLALVGAALCFASRCRLTIVVLGAMPMALLSASGYSADSVTLGLALLLGASVTRFLRTEAADTASRRPFFVLIGCSLGLALCKPPYVLLAGLVLLVPPGVFNPPRRSRVVKAASLLAVGAVAAGWYAVVRDVPLLREADRQAQLDHMLADPWSFVQAAYRGLLPYPNEWGLPRSLVSWVGNFRSRPAGGPLVFALGATVLIVSSYAAEAGRWVGSPARRSPDRQTVARGVVPLVVAAVCTGAILVIEYLTFTPVGATTVGGVQGRYFLPLLVLPALTVAILREPPPERAARTWCFAAGSALLLIGVAFQMHAVFYAEAG
jgi:hypothetical protein